MPEKQQTAVNWLWDKLLEETETGELRYHLKHDIVKVFEQALQMEREQIINAHDGFPIEARNCQNGEEYYEKTYGTDKN